MHNSERKTPHQHARAVAERKSKQKRRYSENSHHLNRGETNARIMLWILTQGLCSNCRQLTVRDEHIGCSFPKNSPSHMVRLLEDTFKDQVTCDGHIPLTGTEVAFTSSNNITQYSYPVGEPDPETNDPE